MYRRKVIAALTKPIALVIILNLLLCGSSFAQVLRVAAAANLQSVIKVLQKDFKQKTHITIQPIISSSGKLAAQIKNGAPFDVFLSADMTLPESLYKEGFSTRPPVVYAYGSLIICSTKNIGFENWERTLLTPRIKKIAIANPAVAPYGEAAKEVLQQKGVFDNVQNKMVYGESISQVNTYITTAVVEVGFTTQALLKDQANKTIIYWKIIDPKSYSPIKQGMVILKHAAGNSNAEKFYKYLLSANAKKIFVKYGYRI
ncbi:molybdate ABC transporter substrate-binding protein [Mucilaginibacter panaciglaebae]|uniref:Molybdate ABC transporter substrate-binding protein n=1 Tax=Mucilaginibacter panaciglaebae TaxID=502331 RepID=A0ABP7WYA7_9SPHI